MPAIIDPYSAATVANKGSQLHFINEYDEDYKKQYPPGLDFKPGSELHDRMKALILQRARESRDFMQRRYTTWQKVDRNLTAYIVPDEETKRIKNADDKKPVNVVIPVSYATLETLLTYFTLTFSEFPVFRYEGVGPEDTVGAMLMEMVVNQQVHRQKMLLDMHTMWRDALVYGFGAVAPIWVNQYQNRTIRQETGFTSMISGLFQKLGFQKSQQRMLTYEGNKLSSIDPYMFLPDPNVSIHRLQDGEFMGWVDRSNFMRLMAEEENDSNRFNTKYLKHIDGRSIWFGQENDSRTERFGIASSALQGSNIAPSTKPVDLIFMYMNVVPSEWKLGDSDYPEKWLFVLAGDAVLIQAQPLNLDHDMYPICVMAPDYDGHGIAPIGRLEIEYGMQEAIDFLYNSHLANVRKSVNNMFIVDPEIINIHDFVNSKAGLLARVRRRFWGQGKLDQAIKQLEVNDITRDNIPHIQFLHDMVKQTSGAVDALQGMYRRTSERVSATEAKQVGTSAVSRLEKAARIGSWQAHYDIAYMLAEHTRQLMSEETWVKMTGRWQEDFAKEFSGKQKGQSVQARPQDLDVNFDVLAHDGTMPASGDPQALIQLLQMASQDQELRQTLDYVRIVKAIARRSGEKNIEDFIRSAPPVQAQVMPDEQVQQQVQAGNLMPMMEGANGSAMPMVQ